MSFHIDSFTGPIITHIRARRVRIDMTRFIVAYDMRCSDGSVKPIEPQDAAKHFGSLLPLARKTTAWVGVAR